MNEEQNKTVEELLEEADSFLENYEYENAGNAFMKAGDAFMKAESFLPAGDAFTLSAYYLSKLAETEMKKKALDAYIKATFTEDEANFRYNQIYKNIEIGLDSFFVRSL